MMWIPYLHPMEQDIQVRQFARNHHTFLEKLWNYHPALLAQLSPKDFQSTTRPSRPGLSALSFRGGSLRRHNLLLGIQTVMVNHDIKAADTYAWVLICSIQILGVLVPPWDQVTLISRSTNLKISTHDYSPITILSKIAWYPYQLPFITPTKSTVL